MIDVKTSLPFWEEQSGQKAAECQSRLVSLHASLMQLYKYYLVKLEVNFSEESQKKIQRAFYSR